MTCNKAQKTNQNPFYDQSHCFQNMEKNSQQNHQMHDFGWSTTTTKQTQSNTYFKKWSSCAGLAGTQKKPYSKITVIQITNWNIEQNKWPYSKTSNTFYI